MDSKDLPTYKDSPDSSKDLQQSEEKDSIYEREYVEHGISCHRIGCTCTLKSDSDKFAEERAAAIRQLHAGRNERARRAKSIRQLNSKPQQAQQDNWSPFPTMEDFEK